MPDGPSPYNIFSYLDPFLNTDDITIDPQDWYAQYGMYLTPFDQRETQQVQDMYNLESAQALSKSYAVQEAVSTGVAKSGFAGSYYDNMGNRNLQNLANQLAIDRLDTINQKKDLERRYSSQIYSKLGQLAGMGAFDLEELVASGQTGFYTGEYADLVDPFYQSQGNPYAGLNLGQGTGDWGTAASEASNVTWEDFLSQQGWTPEMISTHGDIGSNPELQEQYLSQYVYSEPAMQELYGGQFETQSVQSALSQDYSGVGMAQLGEGDAFETAYDEIYDYMQDYSQIGVGEGEFWVDVQDCINETGDEDGCTKVHGAINYGFGGPGNVGDWGQFNWETGNLGEMSNLGYLPTLPQFCGAGDDEFCPTQEDYQQEMSACLGTGTHQERIDCFNNLNANYANAKIAGEEEQAYMGFENQSQMDKMDDMCFNKGSYGYNPTDAGCVTWGAYHNINPESFCLEHINPGDKAGCQEWVANSGWAYDPYESRRFS